MLNIVLNWTSKTSGMIFTFAIDLYHVKYEPDRTRGGGVGVYIVICDIAIYSDFFYRGLL